MNKFFIHNGELERIDSLQIAGLDAFNTPLKVSESIRLYNTKPLLLEEHIMYLKLALQSIHFPIPEELQNTQKIERYITRLLNVNKVYKGGVCELTVQANKGLYIFISSLPHLDFVYNTVGLHLGIDKRCIQFPPILHSEVNSMQSHRLFSNISINEHNYDVVALSNIDGKIFSTNIGDILYVHDDIIHYADSVLNPIQHPITRFCLEQCQKQKLQMKEVPAITEKFLKLADECFIINPLEGVRWVSKIDDEVFGYRLSKQIHLTLLKAVVKVLV